MATQPLSGQSWCFRPLAKFLWSLSILHCDNGAASEHLTTAPEGKVWGFAARHPCIRHSGWTRTTDTLPSTELDPNILTAELSWHSHGRRRDGGLGSHQGSHPRERGRRSIEIEIEIEIENKIEIEIEIETETEIEIEIGSETEIETEIEIEIPL